MTASILLEEKIIILPGNASSSVTIVRKNVDEKCPVILIYTPYPRDSVIQKFGALQLAREAWIIVIASTRGRHGSSGVFEPFVNDASDTNTILDWCIEQSWSDKRIVMMGASYEGFAQWQCAKGNKNLKAIIPTVTSSDLRDWFYENGAFKNAFAQSWGLSLVYTNDQFNFGHARKKVKKLAADLYGLYKLGPMLSPLKSLLPGYLNWLSISNKFWAAIHSSGYPNDCKLPVYICSGWNDIFLNGAIKDYCLREANQKDRLVIGPWSHDSIGSTSDGDVDFGFGADNETFDITRDQLAWIESIFTQREVGKRVSYFLMGKNEWVHVNDWPVKRTIKKFKLHFQTGNTAPAILCINENGTNQKYKEIKFAPNNPPLSFGGKKHHPGMPRAGCIILNQWIQEVKPILFISIPFKKTTNIVGEIILSASFESNVDLFDVYVVIGVINKEKRYISYLEGINRFKSHTTASKKPLPIGTTAFSIAKDEQLFVAITGGSFPNYDNPYANSKKNVIIRMSGDADVALPINAAPGK